MTIKIKCIALLLVTSLAAVPLAAAEGGFARYVVTVDASASQADVSALAARLAREYGGRLEPYAAEGFTGFVIILTPQRAQLLGGDPRVVSMREQRDEFLVTAPEVIAPTAKTALRPVVNAGSTLAFGTYTYDPSGNIHKIAGVSTETYVYDHYNRVLSGTHTMPFPQTPVSQQYTYDRYGNIETIKTTGLPDRTLVVNKSTNQLDASSGNIKGTYDAAGNQRTLTRGDATISAGFEYDALNMATESSIAGVRRHYLYNASDERLASIEAITEFGTTGKQQWTVREPGGQILRRFIRASHSATLQWDEDYLYRGTQMLAAFVTDPEKVIHFHPDHLGSPRLITGNGGAKVEEHRYYAFGEELTLRMAGSEAKKFTGHERDSIDNAPAADVDYMHARYYGMREGRFLSVDPTWESADLGRPQSWNRYAYVENNPTNKIDADGRCPNCIAAAGGALVGALIGGGFELGAQMISGEEVNWRRVGGAAAGGAITGAVAGLTLGSSLVVSAGAGAVANVVAGGTERAIDGDTVYDTGAMTRDLAFGAAGGAAGAAAGKSAAARVEASAAHKVQVRVAESRVRAAAGRSAQRQAPKTAALKAVERKPLVAKVVANVAVTATQNTAVRVETAVRKIRD